VSPPQKEFLQVNPRIRALSDHNSCGTQVGVFAGIGVGLLAAAGMRSVFTSALPLPVWLTPFPTARYAQAATIGLLLPVLATAIPVLRAVRVEPVDALHSGPRTARGARPGLAPLANRLPGRVITLMPIRNLLRSTRRTLLTALGVAASITTLVAVLGVIDSVLGTFDRADAELSRSSPDRLQVSLDRFYPADSPVVEAIGSSPAVATAEPGVVVGSTVSANGVQVDVLAQVLDMDTAMWTPSVRGGDSAGRSGILLAEKAASDLGVVPGDTVVLRHPTLDAEPPRVVATRIPVAGTHPSPLRFFAYLDREFAAGLGLTGPANSVTVRPAPGTDVAGVQRALFSLPGVASVEPVASLADQFRETLDAITGVLRMVEVFALALALLIALNSASIALEERAREQATMFAFGLRVRTVLRMLTVESVATGLLGTLIGVAGGLLAVRWLVNNLTTETVPDLGVPVLVTATSVITTVGLGVLVVGLAPALTMRRLRRMDIPATLRVLE
jgi:putative ABC transport system permease protein